MSSRVKAAQEIFSLPPASLLQENPPTGVLPVDDALAFQSLQDYGAFVDQFISQTLPKSRWTHRAHLVTGLWHLLHHTPEESLKLLRERIRTYNVSVGGVNTDTAGYHETLTRFYVLALAQFLSRHDSVRSDVPGLIRMLLASRLVDKNLPLEFYSQAVLFSPAARRAWMEPDLRPLNIHELLARWLD